MDDQDHYRISRRRCVCACGTLRRRYRRGKHVDPVKCNIPMPRCKLHVVATAILSSTLVLATGCADGSSEPTTRLTPTPQVLSSTLGAHDLLAIMRSDATATAVEQARVSCATLGIPLRLQSIGGQRVLVGASRGQPLLKTIADEANCLRRYPAVQSVDSPTFGTGPSQPIIPLPSSR